MNELWPSEILLEPERYELHAPGRYRFELDRRDFFKALGCGVLVLAVCRTAPGQESGRGRRGGRRPENIGAWLHIGEDGTITAFSGKAEVGQNIRTSLAQAVAEELRVPAASVRLVMADTDLTPYDAGTFGSRTTPDMAVQLHRAAAAARAALLDLAADHFQASRDSLELADGKVTRARTAESVSFGELTRGQKLTRSVSEASVRPAEKWTIAGTSVPKADGRAFVTGAHKYASDIARPGMLHGKVLRPETFEASLASIDSKEAERISGVTVVRDGDFVGVTASDAQTAERALGAIRTEWKTKPQPQPSSEELFEYLKNNASGGGGRGRSSGRSTGSIEEGMRAADHKLQATYTIAYIAHTPLEPRAAVAEWNGGKLTVWTGTQRPFGVRGELAQAFGIPEDRVRVIVPDTGSGYGGKHTGEAAVEAARLAKAAGRPVKLVWTREEEFTWAYFRPAGVIDVSAGVRKDGTITAWEFHNYNSGGSSINTPYRAANQKIEFHACRSPLRQGSYRALAATANHFAREVHIDDLAHAIKMDPLEFRLKNLEEPRMRAVLQAAAEAFGWGIRKPEEGSGFGLAVGTEKGSYIGTCAEVAVDSGSGGIRVVRATAAFECGAVVNPEHLKNQVEGSIVMGLGGALFEAIEFENGAISNPYFSSYRVPRFRDMPQIEVVLVNRPDLPSAGAGETPIVGIAPAVSNAIFAASGIRCRSLPMAAEGRIAASGG